jgi:2,4-dienoyl-CoA reductase-like NADH-dependent reductase (Old Yellow Enzyme family)
LGEPNNVALEDERDMALLRDWATAGTLHGTQLWMQLNHPGKQAPKGLNVETVAPSAIPFRKDMQAFFDTPRALSHEEILDIIQRFGRSAALAKQAGFTGVQIHGAHGYLVSQFLSPLQNQRNDQWGGSAEHRRRFVLEVYRAMRDAVGPAFPIGIKLNSADFQRGGFSEEESLDTIRALGEAGIDLIEISGGTYESPNMSRGVEVPESTRQREAYFLFFAEKARSVTRVPLMVTGGFRTHQGMQQALASGEVDVIGLGRPLAVEPDLSNRVLDGQDPRHTVPAKITTGIRKIDEMALMEVSWYARQLRRMGEGRDPVPDEGAIKSLLMYFCESGWKTFKTRRLRAK